MPINSIIFLLMRYVFLIITVFPVNLYASLPPTSQLSLAPIIKQVSPAVVHVQVVHESTFVSPFSGDPFFDFFFGNQNGQGPFGARQKIRQVAAGSGNIISSDGKVLTCAHVVLGATEIKIKTIDGRSFPAKVMKIDKDNDVALLQINAPSGVTFPALSMGDSDQSEVGDFVLAVGYPFGIKQSVSSGILSSVDQSFLGKSVLQTDAAVNPGNSGGALVNMKGELIGIPNAILSRSGGFHGIGFSIPSFVFKNFIKDANVTSGFHGIVVQMVRTRMNDQNDDDALHSEKGDLVVVGVAPESPGKNGGVREGDIVRTVNGHAIFSLNTWKNRMGALPAGEKVILVVERSGKSETITFTLAPQAQPFITGSSKNKEQHHSVVFVEKGKWKGLGLSPPTEGKGVMIEHAPQNVENDTLVQGDVLIGLNGQKDLTPQSAKESLETNTKGIDVTLRRGNAIIHFQEYGGNFS